MCTKKKKRERETEKTWQPIKISKPTSFKNNARRSNFFSLSIPHDVHSWPNFMNENVYQNWDFIFTCGFFDAYSIVFNLNICLHFRKTLIRQKQMQNCLIKTRIINLDFECSGLRIWLLYNVAYFNFYFFEILIEYIFHVQMLAEFVSFFLEIIKKNWWEVRILGLL